MEKLYSFLGGKKMTLMIVLLLVTIVSLFLNKVNLQDCGAFVLWVYGIYTMGNAAEHISNKKTK